MVNRSLRDCEERTDQEFSSLHGFQVLPIIFLSDYQNQKCLKGLQFLECNVL